MRANHARLASRSRPAGLELRRGNDGRWRRRHRADRLFADDAARAPMQSPRSTRKACSRWQIYSRGHARPSRLSLLGSRSEALEAAPVRTAGLPAHAWSFWSGRSTWTSRRSGDEQDSTRSRFAFEKVASRFSVRLRIGLSARSRRSGDASPLPRHMKDPFELVAVADPSATVRDSLQRLYNSTPPTPITKSCSTTANLDAVVICSPAQTACSGDTRALERASTLRREADVRHARAPTESPRRDNGTGRCAGRLHEALRPRVGADARGDAGVRRVSPVTSVSSYTTQSSDPYFAPGEIARGSDIPRGRARAGREQMRAQVR